tara:strand:- start:272 stop:442 length:171 start_codon:yes stop_codon:yes gene_type:complete
MLVGVMLVVKALQVQALPMLLLVVVVRVLLDLRQEVVVFLLQVEMVYSLNFLDHQH